MTNENKVDTMLSKLDKKQLRKLKNPRSIFKIQRMLTSGFCAKCRSLALNDSTRSYNDYCNDCQLVATKVLGDILK